MKKAFTLLEILIATTIFSSVMIMTTGVVGQSTGYQAKLHANRGVYEESRRITEQISDDLRAANASGEIDFDDDNNGTTTLFDYKNGVAVFDCDYTSYLCNQVNHVSPADFNDSASSGNTILIFSQGSDGQKNMKVYFSAQSAPSLNSKIYYREYKNISEPVSVAQVISTSNLGITGIIKDQYIFSGPDDSEIDSKVSFSGYAPCNIATFSEQPYVDYKVDVQTRGADLRASEKASTEIRTMITLRSFGS